VGIRNNAVLAGKACLLVIFVLVGLAVLGCAGIRSAPEGGSGGTIADGTLFLSPALKPAGGFGCAAPAGEGKLVAMNTSDGSRLWEVSLETAKPAGGGFGCAPAPTPVAVYGNPAVAGGLVYVGGYNGKIYAINSSSGALRWVYPREGNLRPIVSGVVAALGKVYFGCSDGKVYALDAATGDKQWEFPTGDKIWSTPAIGDETLYIGSFDKKLYALSATDGSKKWEFETEGAIASTPLVYNNMVYVGSFDRHLYAVGASDGKVRWQFLAEKWFWGRPVAFNDTIYAGCFDGRVYALGAESGGKLAEFDLGSPVHSWPVLVGSPVSASPVPVGDLIIASEEGKVYTLDTSNNQIRLLADLGEAIYAPLCASDRVIYIYSQGRNLYALNATSGAKLWSQIIK
jgi:outer membrane protein assembly factor BamB